MPFVNEVTEGFKPPKFEKSSSKEISKRLTKKYTNRGSNEGIDNRKEVLDELMLEFLQGVEVYYTPFHVTKGIVKSYEVGSIIKGNRAFIGLLREPPVLEGVEWKETIQKNGIPIHYGIEENKSAKEA